MSTVADLPASAVKLANPLGAGGMGGHADALRWEEQITWRVPHEDFGSFVVACLYTPATLTVSGGTVTRNVPLVHPYLPFLHALGVDYRAFSPNDSDDVDGDPFEWGDLDCTVTFGQLPFATDGDQPFVEIQTEGSVQDFTLPNYAYSFLGTAERIAQDVGVPVGSVRKVIHWHAVPDPDAAEAIVGPLMGLVNNAVLTMGGLVCPIDTVHFQTYSLSETRSLGGVRNARLSLQTAIRTAPTWNQAMRKTGAFGTLDPLPFGRGNLAALLNGY